MKLWYQSSAPLGINPEWEGYEKALDKHIHNVARPGTEIDLHGVKAFSPGVNTNRYDRYLHTSQIIDAAIQAEREGYDAFVQTVTFDYAYHEIKEAISIPAVFTIETALHIATMLAPKFAFLVMNPSFMAYLIEKAREYGFQERMAPSGCVEIDENELTHAFKDPRHVIDILSAEAKRIGEQGANILICAGNPITMLLVDQGLTEIGGVPFLDSLGVGVKMAEMMVDLNKMGINRDKMGLYSPQPKEKIDATRKIYGLE